MLFNYFFFYAFKDFVGKYNETLDRKNLTVVILVPSHRSKLEENTVFL